MAGGMAKKGAPLPAWLVAANTERRLAAEEAMRQRRPSGNPFVWVVGSEADYPGIVVDRRRVGAGWQILVAYTSPRHELMQQWLDAEQLLPYESRERVRRYRDDVRRRHRSPLGVGAFYMVGR